ncbi:hypothetical protein ACK8GE_21035 [Micromonosporaceae bacterium DT194]|uniref:hypothetical protein n=1 Tax=Melissospora conviva TaxID=3388432 RepID=UPI003C1DF19D
MSSLATRVNTDPDLAAIPITTPDVQNHHSDMPVLCVQVSAAPAFIACPALAQVGPAFAVIAGPTQPY